MTVDVLTEVLIDAPPEVVSGYAADPGNAPEWYRNIDSVTWESPPPLAVGSRLGFVASFLGRELVYTYEVTDWVPGSRLVMRTAQGPFPMETTYTWEPAGTGGTRMTLRNRGEPSGFARVAAPVLAASVRRANRADLDRLRSVVERRGGGTGPAGQG
jgi:uncharacterized protein YndB with AHSA1/START domain